MRMAFSRSAEVIPVCRQAGLRLAAFPAGKAKKAEKAEGKIEETGTMSGRFPKLLLPAHCLWWAATGTMVLDPACRDLAQDLGVAGFRLAPWPSNARFSAG